MSNAAALAPGYITRAVALPRSQDYAWLRRRGLQYIERLAHLRWTDYNVHDPGITILELLCYAITDAGLRAAYPMKDLLATQGARTWQPNTPYKRGTLVTFQSATYQCLQDHTSTASQNPGTATTLWTAYRNFHLAHEILVSRPVSFDDLRRLLIDIPGIRNAWVERHRGVQYAIDERHKVLTAADQPHSIELNGLFNVYLEYEDFVAGGDPTYRSSSHVGLPDASGQGDYIAAAGKGLEFAALEDGRLDQVTVYPDGAGTIIIRLLHGREEVARRQRTVSAAAGTAVRFDLNFPLKAGRVYRLDVATGTTAKLHRTKRATYPMPAAGPVRIDRGYAAGSTPDAGQQSYYFFYDWQVAHDSAGLTKGEVRAEAVDCIHEHRNLCEDVINVCDLIPEDVAICADIELRADADTNAVHAEILYRVFTFISPAVPFRSLEELQAKGKTIDEIFDGPLLTHGFIDDDELKALRRRCEIHASDILHIIMEVDGVVAVKSLKLLKRSEPGTLYDWILPLSADRFRIATFVPFDIADGTERFGSRLTFYKRGLPYYTSRKAVEPLFNEQKAADIERKLKVRQHALDVPAGEWRDPGGYEPIQNELPITYRVGRIHVPDSDPVRQAQSRQLTAYLLLFDQLLANYVAQLSHVGDLLTWRELDFRTYFTQQITGVFGIDPVTRDGVVMPGALDRSKDEGFDTFREALDAIAETPAGAEQRRLRLLEHLVARYAEELDEYKALMRPMLRAAFEQLPRWTAGTAYAVGVHVAHDGAEYVCIKAHTAVAARPPRVLPDTWRQTSRLVAQLRRFLEDYPALSANRGGAFDWRWPAVASNVAGYQRRVYRMLDIDPVVRRQLAGHRFVIADHGTTTPEWRFELEDDDGVAMFRSIACEAKSSIEALLDLALRLGGDRASYDESAGHHTLVQRCAEDATPDAIGETTGVGTLADVMAYFKETERAEGFHLVEHILCRRRTRADPFLPVQLEAPDECCPPVSDPYSFRVSIVLPSWSPRFRNMRFRHLVEDTLRREAPAHVYPRICWVNHEQMKNLEIALEGWQSQLAWLSHDAGACSNTDGTRTGRLPLPAATNDADNGYAAALTTLITRLYGLTNVYPLAQIHDCDEVDGDTPQVTLGNTSLGTL